MSDLMDYHARKIISAEMVQAARGDIELMMKRGMVFELIDHLLDVDNERIKIDVTFTREVVKSLPSMTYVFPKDGDIIIEMTAKLHPAEEAHT